MSSELHKTWGLVGRLQAQHQQLHTHEKILRYELHQKRELLSELKQELEYCREKWESAREKNSQTDREWRLLRREFAARKTRDATRLDDLNNSTSGESGLGEDSGEDDADVSSGRSETPSVAEDAVIASPAEEDLAVPAADLPDDPGLAVAAPYLPVDPGLAVTAPDLPVDLGVVVAVPELSVDLDNAVVEAASAVPIQVRFKKSACEQEGRPHRNALLPSGTAYPSGASTFHNGTGIDSVLLFFSSLGVHGSPAGGHGGRGDAVP